MTMIDLKHLRESYSVSGRKPTHAVGRYLWHWGFAMKEAVMLAWLAVLSVIHAFVPWLFGWGLLEKHVEMLKYTKSKVPNNKTMKTVKFLKE